MKKRLTVFAMLLVSTSTLVAAPRPNNDSGTVFIPAPVPMTPFASVMEGDRSMIALLVSNEAAVAMMRDLVKRPDTSPEQYRRDEDTLGSILFGLRYSKTVLSDDDREALRKHSEIALRHLHLTGTAGDEDAIMGKFFNGRLPNAVFMEVIAVSDQLGVRGVDVARARRLINGQYAAAIAGVVKKLRDGDVRGDERTKYADALVRLVNFSQYPIRKIGIDEVEYDRLSGDTSLPEIERDCYPGALRTMFRLHTIGTP